MLSAVDTAVLANLPAAQRAALERVLLLEGEGPPTNERMVAAAFLSVIQHPGVDAPVLMAIDDAQWLDVSSQAVFGYAARRLSGRVGILATVRTGEPGLGDPPSWLRFARPDSTVRIRMSPLSLGGVHALISKRLGHTLPRPVITRIHEISGGNPFFALELARSVADEPSRGVVDLPDSLAVLVRQRIGQPDDELSAVLLAASCTVFPTVERLSRAIDLNIDRVVEVIESAEASGVVALEGNEIRFCHPLFASGVYTGASPPQRRAMHRKLADTVEEPELKARHLALAATTGDPAMLDALDEAAEVTLAQGAPAVAAELLELAIKLGGDTPVRRIRAAERHFVPVRSGGHEAFCIDHRWVAVHRPVALRRVDVAGSRDRLRREHDERCRCADSGCRGRRGPSAAIAKPTAADAGGRPDWTDEGICRPRPYRGRRGGATGRCRTS